jgi:hypothetical protein
MKIENLMSRLESIRLRAEGNGDWLDKEITVLEIIQALVEYVNNPKVSDKIDEIPF